MFSTGLKQPGPAPGPRGPGGPGRSRKWLRLPGHSYEALAEPPYPGPPVAWASETLFYAVPLVLFAFLQRGAPKPTHFLAPLTSSAGDMVSGLSWASTVLAGRCVVVAQAVHPGAEGHLLGP